MIYKIVHRTYLLLENILTPILGRKFFVQFRHQQGKAILCRRNLPILLNFLNLKGNGIEIGVARGNYSEQLFSESSLSKLYLVDPWIEYSEKDYQDICNVSSEKQEENYQYVLNRFKKYGKRCQIVRKTSLEAVSDFQDHFFDFIYIDANHSYEACKEDIELWWPKLKSGGLFAGHDYMQGEFPTGIYGVKKAVDEFIIQHNLKLYFTSELHSTWYCIKLN